jgi:hypothetical protein
MLTGDEYRELAKTAENEKAASFERCDTDGFASQAASGLNADLNRAKAKIADNGGKSIFPALFDLNGNFIDAVERKTQYGYAWVDVNGNWYNPSKANDEKRRVAGNANKGFYIGTILAPANAALAGGGRGFSGMASVYVDIYRTTKGNDGVEIVDNGVNNRS